MILLAGEPDIKQTNQPISLVIVLLFFGGGGSSLNVKCSCI